MEKYPAFPFFKGLLDIFFPEYCAACNNRLQNEEFGLCLPCLASLPLTDFHNFQENPLYHQLIGRIPISGASAGFYFRKGNSIQKILHEIKYKKAWKAARILGRYYGNVLFSNPEYQDIDYLIPVPLHPKRLLNRGFNQSEEFALGLSEVIQKPVQTQSLFRKKYQGSQSHKPRESRFDLLANDFILKSPEEIKAKKVLLVDDLITTGATVEACCRLLYPATGIPIKIASLAYTLI